MRTEVYYKEYKKDIYDGFPAEGDDIIQSLEKICINITMEKSHHPLNPNKETLNYFDGKTMVWIETMIHKCLKASNYERGIKLKIMPSESETPEELSNLLVKKGFQEKKLK